MHALYLDCATHLFKPKAEEIQACEHSYVTLWVIVIDNSHQLGFFNTSQAESNDIGSHKK